MWILKSIYIKSASEPIPSYFVHIFFLIFLQAFLLSGCILNNPYTDEEIQKNILFSSFSERPKKLDPARSYSSDEYRLICRIYEPPLQYHYLKRPYELIPLVAEHVPVCRYYDTDGNEIKENAPAAKVSRAVWTIRIKKGILYQNHPCFAKNKEGEFLYQNLTEQQVHNIRNVFDFKKTGTRELKARDYVYQIKRLADMRLQCPIYATIVSEYFLGMPEFSKHISKRIEEIRKKRKKEQGIFYNREEDERNNPIIIDYHSIPCKAVEIVDDYTYRIILNKKYPQLKFWLAMPFFAPMPEETIRFYSQKQNIDRNIILDWFPVGTGTYRMARYDPNRRIELVKNENYRKELYPSDGEAGDRGNGLLDDADKELPLIHRIVYSREKEHSPEWRKFLQGYYDMSGISSENFSKVMDLSVSESRLSEEMSEKGIGLTTSVRTTVVYMGFNMGDPVVGGLDEKKCKLRQALSLALNREEYIQIFLNGRGIVAHSPIPPGIYGYESGKAGINAYTHKWDEKRQSPVRKNVSVAAKLLAEAGYPEGIGPDGKQLVLYYDTVQSPGNAMFNEWRKKQFASLNVKLITRETDYNRFREKMSTGNYQLFGWGWNADYPDPENFLFLLYGPNGRVKYHGENAANYTNPEYDRLFEQMKTMENGPERLQIIRKMIQILRHDAPWEFGYYPKSFSLFHEWVHNVKPNPMANNTTKYIRIDPQKRKKYITTYNQPRLMILSAGVLVLLLVIVPGLIKTVRGERN